MRSKQIQNLLRILIVGVGAGAGAALAFTCVQVYRMTTAEAIPFGLLALLYAGMGAAGGLAGWLLAPKAIHWCSDATGAMERYMDSLSTAQLAAMSAGLITGLLIAALLTQVLNYLGDSMLTLAVSAVLYVILGVTGVSIGKRRTEEFSRLLASKEPRGERRAARSGQLSPKLLDATVLTDGRLEPVLRTGFVEGALIVPDFVLEELRGMAEGADEARKLSGRRGLDTAGRLQNDALIRLKVEETGEAPGQDGDIRLMTLAREMNAVLMTGDHALNRAARAIGLKVLNLNDLACAMRQTMTAGDQVSVRLTREGREAGQGVGYLEDGTMIVVEGGRGLVGETVQATVTSVLQTSAGRMVFAKVNERDV